MDDQVLEQHARRQLQERLDRDKRNDEGEKEPEASEGADRQADDNVTPEEPLNASALGAVPRKKRSML